MEAPLRAADGSSTLRENRRAALGAAALLAGLYALTAAPSVTWWDAGEFLAATHTLGIPHPPGTPLYILIARAWSLVFGWVDLARIVNLLSAACTAAAGGIVALLIAQALRRGTRGIAAAICAGAMSTVWLSATEAEVYGASLLLGMLMLWSGDRAGRYGEARYIVLTGYLFALAAPLHVTALVAAPAALLLASTGSNGGMRWHTALVLGAALVAAGGIGTGRWWVGLAATVSLIVIALVPCMRATRAWLITIAVLIGFSAFAFLILRARHDPAINQGNPADLAALLSVIARDQYDIASLFPRQAPVWLQVVNFFEYADWQVALGLGPTVTPTVPRTLVTVIFIALGAMGSRAHWQTDRRSWRAFALLGLCGSLGVVAYLNLKAGPSIGYGFIPDEMPHEARERDYFFVLAFWTWGAWAGIGAMESAERWLAPRRRNAVILGLIVAALPAALNVRQMNRRSEPEASLPLRVARELLGATPDRAVLLVAGDNDTYPLWFAQQVLGIRRDVVIVTYPLMSAGWYRDELYRRWGLGVAPPHEQWRGIARELADIGTSAREQGRPIAASVTVDRDARAHLGSRWRLTGLVYVEDDAVAGTGDPVIDAIAAAAAAARLESVLRRPLRVTIDPTGRLMRESLECPSLALRAATDTTAGRLLDSTCNYR